MTSVDQVATYNVLLKNVIINDEYIDMQFVAEKYNTVSIAC